MLPGGVHELAGRLSRAGATLLAARGGPDLDVSDAAIRARIDPGAPASRAPLRVGAGAVAADLGVAENAQAFAALRAVAPAEVLGDPEALAAAAQTWRLPVVPYRTPETGARGRVRILARRDVPAPPPAPGPPLVLDLTTMWAGPLATALLAATGARVVTIEPAIRRDGMRDTPHVFAQLAAGKRRAAFDLRATADRERFLALAARATLVVESCSPRVLGNLRIDHPHLDAIAPGITILSLPAFDPATPERDWVAYGTGVHAACGLGATVGGGFAAPPFPYPDPLAGLLAFAVAQALLLARACAAWDGGHVVAPMTAATAALAVGPDDLAAGFAALPGVPGPVLDLLAAA